MHQGGKRLLAWAGAIAVALMLLPAAASADSQTFNANFFTPATGRNTSLMLHGTPTLRARAPSVCWRWCGRQAPPARRRPRRPQISRAPAASARSGWAR